MIYCRQLDNTQRAHQAGSITLTEILDADRQLLTAQDELDANQAAAAQTTVGIFRALGEGWDAPHRPPGLQQSDASPNAG